MQPQPAFVLAVCRQWHQVDSKIRRGAIIALYIRASTRGYHFYPLFPTHRAILLITKPCPAPRIAQRERWNREPAPACAPRSAGSQHKPAAWRRVALFRSPCIGAHARTRTGRDRRESKKGGNFVPRLPWIERGASRCPSLSAA